MTETTTMALTTMTTMTRSGARVRSGCIDHPYNPPEKSQQNQQGHGGHEGHEGHVLTQTRKSISIYTGHARGRGPDTWPGAG